MVEYKAGGTRAGAYVQNRMSLQIHLPLYSAHTHRLGPADEAYDWEVIVLATCCKQVAET